MMDIWKCMTDRIWSMPAALIVLAGFSSVSAEKLSYGTKPHFSRFSNQSPRFPDRPSPSVDSTIRRLSPASSDAVKRQLDTLGSPETPSHAVRWRKPKSDVVPSPADSHLTRDIARYGIVNEVSTVWWENPIRDTVLNPATTIPISLESLITSALEHSAQIQVYKELPLIRETAIMEADASFDWTSFVESRWNDINEPVGNLLTTNEDRFSDHNLNTSVGARRKNTLGGQFEVSQRFGQQNTNSQFFIPHNQATTRLTLGYTQPLLRGAGKVYNTSLTVLAAIEKGVADEELSNQLQNHLLEVARAYWGLYLERGNLLQRRRLYERAQAIYDALSQRAHIDALKSQIVRARSAVTSRRADILRAEMAVKNSESRIRALVNDPSLGTFDSVELLPQDRPFDQYMEIDIPSSVEQAIQNRPEINQAMQQVKASGVRFNMSKNELLPTLNLILETYTAGLRGNSNINNAFTDQFGGEPSYSVGLQYEFPLWNRAAQARYQRRRLELRQMEAQFRTTLETLKLEVEVASREVSTTYREVDANFRAMDAARAEVEYLQDRWQLLPGDDRSASLLLEDLLDAQERLTAAEYQFLDTQLSYSLAQMSYKKAIGSLLVTENITADRYCDCYLPSIDLRRGVRHTERDYRQDTESTEDLRETEKLPTPRASHSRSSRSNR